MNNLFSSSRMITVAMTLAAIVVINKFVPATRNPLK